MMRLGTISSVALGGTRDFQRDAMGMARSVEEAFDSFVVMLWQMAQVQDSASGWARICEHLYTLRLFLDRLGLPHLAEMSSDLMSLANCRADMGTGRSGPVRPTLHKPSANRPRAF